MQSSPNWSVLYEQGRCKEIGVPWSDAELKAIYEFKVPYQYVRQGCLTQEAYQAALEDVNSMSEKPLFHMKRDELVTKAVALGIDFDVNVVNRQTLMTLIKEKQEQSK